MTLIHIDLSHSCFTLIADLLVIMYSLVDRCDEMIAMSFQDVQVTRFEVLMVTVISFTHQRFNFHVFSEGLKIIRVTVLSIYIDLLSMTPWLVVVVRTFDVGTK